VRGLDGKVAIVTGGGNGIGRAACLRFAEEGTSVVVADLLEDSAAKTAAECEELGGRATAMAVDVSDPAANDAMVEVAVESFRAVDVLVTAAGIPQAGYRSDEQAQLERAGSGGAPSAQTLGSAEAFVHTSLADYERVMAVNLTGTMLSMQSVARWMLENGRGGSIVTVASIASKHPEPSTVPYALSKAGVWMLTKKAAAALASAGIRVNAVGPGFVETNMTAIVRANPPVHDYFLRQIPMGRMGTPEEMAAVIAFLASDEASYVTGEQFHPDGGYYTD
jgi:NAD(P)-dependent dehydrogenase (short-subunit alcohol dehydrogenase family)